MSKPAAFLVALPLFAALLVGGCDKYIDLPTCGSSHPEPHCAEQEQEQETCPGQCVPIPPVHWADPILLWSGDELLAPACPADRAGQQVYTGHADPSDPPPCPTCTCEPPTGECELPSVLTASTGFCGEPGMLHDLSGLDPTECNTEHPVPANQSPKSVTIAPLVLTESGCKPPDSMPPLENGGASWKTYARGCRGVAYPPCLNPSKLCVPTAEPPPEGFAQCIYREGDHECPPDYPQKRLFFDKGTDTRSCSPCSCGDPTGSVCSAKVTMYQDTDCTVEAKYGNPTSTNPECINLPVPPDVALLGKKVENLTYAPGSCPPSGGEPVGAADLVGPSTFCCQP